ncbi:MAG: glucuronyl hydrolase, partial [Bacteroidota bacterium]
RGQAWGLYGFVVCYRYTQDPKYLAQAQSIADFITQHPQMPKDGVPYWDFHAPNIPDEPRDVSAAAITASALVELNRYTGDQYAAFVNKVMNSLAAEPYSVPLKREPRFVLDHSVGSIPHGGEIDQPLVYADYYYLEALMRIREAERNSSQVVDNY